MAKWALLRCDPENEPEDEGFIDQLHDLIESVE
jgi:hypothetical protein